MNAIPSAPSAKPPGRLTRLFAGAGYLARGLRLFLATPGVWLLGVIPALIASVLVVGVLVLLVVYLDEAAGTLTPFATQWSEGARTAVRATVGLALLGGYLTLVVLTFAALTNMIGQPFYERLSDRIEATLGDRPAGVDAPWWRTLPRATLESVGLLVVVLACTAPLFLLGLLPVIGQTLVPVAGALVSGFFLAIELLAIPLQRRGLRLRERLRFVWRHRAMTVGFGVAAFLLFLIPLANIVFMPGAIVGGTLLVRHLSGHGPR
jgi:CysZ protein